MVEHTALNGDHCITHREITPSPGSSPGIRPDTRTTLHAIRPMQAFQSPSTHTQAHAHTHMHVNGCLACVLLRPRLYTEDNVHVRADFGR